MRALDPRSALDGVGNAVALTFDDGPDALFTPQVLDVLAEHGVRATFFLVGRRAESHPELVRRMAAEGHAIGSHTWSHPLPWTVGALETLREQRAGRRAVEAAAGRTIRLFRPPKGYLTGRIALAALAARLDVRLWTLDPEDWQPGVVPDEILGRLQEVAAGDVILLHDAIEGPLAPEAEDRWATVEALPGVIELIRGRGLELVPIESRG
jgi:peptidoglycan/xylan/chitin deacetylase (PgdA/CDA1 family)